MYRLVGKLLVLAGFFLAVGRRISAPSDELSGLLGAVVAAVGLLLFSLNRADDGPHDAPRPARQPEPPRSRSLPEPPFAPAPPPFEVTVGGRRFVFDRRRAQPRDVHVRVGKPVPGEDGRWLCPYQIQGLGPRRPRVAFGLDSLGAC